MKLLFILLPKVLILHIYIYAEYTRIPYSFCAQFIHWNHSSRCYLCLLSSICHFERTLKDFLQEEVKLC
jgi:hypothetical protein